MDDSRVCRDVVIGIVRESEFLVSSNVIPLSVTLRHSRENASLALQPVKNAKRVMHHA